MANFLHDFTLAFVAIDPIALAPMFISLTAGCSSMLRIRIALVAFLVSLGILMLFYSIGNNLLLTLGISMSAFRIAGGVFLMIVAIDMLFESRNARKNETASDAAKKADLREQVMNLAVFPLAIPLIAGPAAILLSMVIASRQQFGTGEYFIGFLPIAAVMAITCIAMLASSFLLRVLGTAIPMVLQRLFGLFLGAIAVGFVIEGIKETFNLTT